MNGHEPTHPAFPRVIEVAGRIRVELAAARSDAFLTTSSDVEIDVDADGRVADLNLMDLPVQATSMLSEYSCYHEGRRGAVSLDVNADWLWIRAADRKHAERRRYAAEVDFEFSGNTLLAVTITPAPHAARNHSRHWS